MKQPKGFSEKGKDFVYLLNKALYGLKQASRTCYEKMNNALLDLDFKRSSHEPCVFIKKFVSEIIILALYVDDLLIFPNSKKLKDKLKEKLISKIDMQDLGLAKHVLGMEIEQSKNTIEISQSRYIENVLQKFGMSDCNPISTPLETNMKLMKPFDNDLETENNLPYQSLIGCLTYIAVNNRPDIAYPVSVFNSITVIEKSIG